MDREYEICLIDKYWSTANYLTVATMYLKENIFMNRKLTKHDLKERPIGHWGTSPGINFIYAHLNAFIRRYNINDAALVVGTGHSAVAVMVNLYLEGSLTSYYPEITNNEDGIRTFVNSFCKIGGFRTENNPSMPGNIYDGGELGYSLSVSFGASFDSKERIIFCIIGDGEAETGSIATGWNGFKFWDYKSSGVVLPIINLNGRKMGSESILSKMTEIEINKYFEGLGYNCFIVHESHLEMYEALNKAYSIIIRNRQKKCNDKDSKIYWPIIVFKSVKGWTAVENEEGKLIEGSNNAHKIPVLSYDLESKVRILSKWLNSYNPRELFEKGMVKSDLNKIIPQGLSRLGMFNKRIEKVNIGVNKVNIAECFITESKYSNTKILDIYFKKLISKNDNFRIFSPDEFNSNGFKIDNDIYNSKIMEILSENTCQAWMQGYILTGRYAIMPTYEAFAPIITSMVSQYIKYLKQMEKVNWRKRINAMNYLLTSLCWANTYSHQNPEFINSILCKDLNYVNVLFPCDANCLLYCIDKYIFEKNKVNVIISSKKELPQVLSREEAKDACERGYYEIVYRGRKSDFEFDYILACSGDHPLSECIKVIEYMKKYFKGLNFKFVYFINITLLCECRGRYKGLNDSEFEKIFPINVDVIFDFHGYSSAISSLIFDRYKCERFDIIGYCDEGDVSAPTNIKYILNNVSKYHIIKKIIMILLKNKKITEKEYNSCFLEQEDKIEKLLNKYS